MKKAIKNYNDHAEDWSRELRAGRKLPHEYIEKPAMYTLLPDLKGRDILCVGCGTGEECNYLLKSKPNKIIGFDLADKMIVIAKKNYPGIEFQVLNLEKMNYSANSFDFVYSSLTLHYSKKWPKILSDIHRFLRKDGTFLFSVLHPLYWGTEYKNNNHGRISRILGVETVDGKNNVHGDYLNASMRQAMIYGGVEIEYYNQPISKMLDSIQKAGFSIEKVVEPKPKAKLKEINPEYYKIVEKMPQFIIFKVKKD